ncbi:polycystin-1-like protein 3 [Microcebus murinus]|uniref:polycystin-1-like protein 3 n=1 Tax=Microcebus murinus TaxID=30608 RepID=UPI003F6A6F75
MGRPASPSEWGRQPTNRCAEGWGERLGGGGGRAPPRSPDWTRARVRSRGGRASSASPPARVFRYVAAPAHPPKPSGCTYLSEDLRGISSKKDKCSRKYYFICQTEFLCFVCHHSDPAERPLCYSINPFPLRQPNVTPGGSSVGSVTTSQPLPVTTELTRPVTHAGKVLAEMTSSPKEDSQTDVFTYIQASFQNASDQFINGIAEKFSRAVHGLQAHDKLQEACKILRTLTAFAPQLSKPAQVSVINSLIYLSEQLLKMPFQNSSSRGFKNSVTVSLFHSVNNVMEAGEVWQNSEQEAEQVEDMLEMSLAALRNIQEAFLQQNHFLASPLTVTSSVSTLMLSSQNISTLPLSSYTLGHPAPMRLCFPSAWALEKLLNKCPRVNVQVAGLALNPFKHFGDGNIVGSIGSVKLSYNNTLLQVQDLMEDIEIILWRNVSVETHPISLNTSTDRFAITVNVTSSEKALIVSIEPESPLLMTLYLGYQYQPNHTHFHLNITLPKDQVWQKDEEYTWVLTQESLRYGPGTYYITATWNGSQDGAQLTPPLVSVVTASTQCYFWDSQNRTWRSNGCQVGPRSTILRTQCFCNHLTFFSSDFVVVPRTVHVEDTIKLFLRVTSNPVGVSLLASLLGFYLIIVTWAWRKDQADVQKVKVTVLADNDPDCQFCYLVQVYTGYRRRAATTAKVVITLYGSEGRSEPHHLWDPQKTVFERGGLDVFLLTTRSSLGQLHGLRLWHDNSGASPSWYVSQVIVSDVAVKRKWHFLCNCWLAVDIGDCEQDRVFVPASERELLSFRHTFSSVIVEKFTQDYLWLSVATRHPWSRFTRVQRLSCCVTLLLCNMVTSVMFWKGSGPAPERDARTLSPFALTWSELLVSVQTAVILFPVNLVVGQLFPLIQPQETLPPPLPSTQASCLSDASIQPLSLTQVVEELKETVGFLLRRNPYLLSECDQSSWSSHDINKLATLLSSLIYSHLEGQGCHQAEPPWANGKVAPENHRHFCCYLLRVLQRLKCHIGTLGLTQGHQPWDSLDTASQLQKLQELLKTHTLPSEEEPSREITSFPMLSSGEGKNPISGSLPTWLPYICWLLLGVTSLASAFFTALYSLELNRDQATSWVVSIILSVLQNIFLSQPVKVIVLTFLLSLMTNRMPWLNKEKEQQTRRVLALLAKCSSPLPGLRDKNNPIYVAPAMNSPTKHPERTLKEKRLFRLTGDILVQILFLILLMTTVYSARNSNRFYLRQAIWKSFSQHFSEIKLLEDFYPWANHTLLPNLYGDYRGFITDGNSFLLGNVLLRQIRIPNATLSPATVSPQERARPSHQHQEDTGNYGVNWGPPDTSITESDSIWHYQKQETLGGYPVQGEFATYSGGGYVVKLGRNSSTATRVLQHLEQSHWLDQCTKCLFVEFVVFNANVNLFCVVTLILESSDVGAFFTSVRLDSLPSLQTSKKGFAWSVIAQVVYYLLVCYYAFVQGRRLKRQRWKFFSRKRNILVTGIILISFTILGLDVKSISLHKKYMAQYHRDRDRFVSFYEAVKVNSAAIHLAGFLVLLATVQLWNLLHRNARLQVIGRTLSKAWGEVVGFLLIILILLTSYAIAFNLLFGWSISDYQTFVSSAMTVVGLLMGISHHKEVIALDPVLGSFLILTSVILIVLVIINLFVSAILMAFRKERKSPKKEATVVDMLLQKFSSLLGIQRYQNPSSMQEAMTAMGKDIEVVENELP